MFDVNDCLGKLGIANVRQDENLCINITIGTIMLTHESDKISTKN